MFASLGASADCVTTSLAGCNVSTSGTLAQDDCTRSDGTRFDRFVVQLPAKRIVSITLRPLDATYTNPLLTALPPAGDPSAPPTVHGPHAATVWLRTGNAAAEWTITAGAADPLAHGAYALHLFCFDDAGPSARNCVTQELLCGHTAEDSLTDQSCHFGENRAFTYWALWGSVGDRVLIEMKSSGSFEPLFGLYDDQQNLLAASLRVDATTATMGYPLPRDGWYYILATTVENNRTGNYTLHLDCRTSGCLFPWFRSQIPDQTVERGSTATINLDLSVVGRFNATLFENLTTVAGSTTSTITTPAINSERRFSVRVETPCGNADSNFFTIGPPEEKTKKRSVRH